MALTVAGCINDGVPPPRKMLDTVRPGARSARACDLLLERGQEARLVDRGVADVTVEVAVRALRKTKGPVDVNAERVGLA